MQTLTNAAESLAAHLECLATSGAPGRTGPASDMAGRLVAATLHTLTTPPGPPLPARPHPSATAARSTAAAAPTTGRAPAPAEAAIPLTANRPPPARQSARGR